MSVWICSPTASALAAGEAKLVQHLSCISDMDEWFFILHPLVYVVTILRDEFENTTMPTQSRPKHFTPQHNGRATSRKHLVESTAHVGQ